MENINVIKERDSEVSHITIGRNRFMVSQTSKSKHGKQTKSEQTMLMNGLYGNKLSGVFQYSI